MSGPTQQSEAQLDKSIRKAAEPLRDRADLVDRYYEMVGQAAQIIPDEPPAERKARLEFVGEALHVLNTSSYREELLSGNYPFPDGHLDDGPLPEGRLPLKALTQEQSHQLADAIFGPGPGSALLKALSDKYDPTGSQLIKRVVAEPRGQGFYDFAEGCRCSNLPGADLTGAFHDPQAERATNLRFGKLLYETTMGTNLDVQSLTPADVDVISHLGRYFREQTLERLATPNNDLEPAHSEYSAYDMQTNMQMRAISINVSELERETRQRPESPKGALDRLYRQLDVKLKAQLAIKWPHVDKPNKAHRPPPVSLPIPAAAPSR